MPEYKLTVNSYMKICFVFLSINHGASGNIYTTFFIYMYMIGIFFPQTTPKVICRMRAYLDLWDSSGKG